MNPPESFAFPFQPYDIQNKFMRELYTTIEQGNLGIFESPTGTGKSLSLCCGAIQWLKDHNENEKLQLMNKMKELKIGLQNNEHNNDEADWLHSEYDKIRKNEDVRTLQKKLDSISLRTEKLNKIRARKVSKQTRISNKFHTNKENTNKQDIENIENDICSNETDIDNEFLLEDNDQDESEEIYDECNEEEKLSDTKIFFCSRTHSQLSQFISEIKKTSHCTDVSVISLASRQHYCINPSVQKMKNQNLINERCLDLQRGKKGKVTLKTEDGKAAKKIKKSSGCPFYNQNNIEDLKNEALIDIKDVEDLINDAKQLKACPYYGARAAVKESQVIVVPYQTILHKPTRCANGIDLKNNIVIIDEAHNLLEMIGHIYSTEITGLQLKIALERLKHYKNKYSTRFAAKNLLYINQIIFIAERIFGELNALDKTSTNESHINTLEEFVLKAEIDHYKFQPLLDFCACTKLAQKLHGFSNYFPKEEDDKMKNKSNIHGLESFLNQITTKTTSKTINVITENAMELENEKQISVGNVVQSLLNFLEMLTSTYADGRIITFRKTNVEESYHKFLLLNPAAQFYDIVQDARAVIVAGGTMQPFSEFQDQLLLPAGAAATRITEFSCGHVISPENILPICLSEGPSGKRLNFTYELRKTLDMLNEVGRIILNICNIVPGGIVCFFPSYDYEKEIYNHLVKNGIVEKIQKKKKIFREPKTTTQVDKVLDDYSKIIKHCINSEPNTSLTGALMLSVVGGKLSEGLNFSDDLGRCVMVIGMPYPNVKSVELQEKMKYLKENVSPEAGSVYYENLCLKAINQCIGRAVRHINDYATVILIDERYSRNQVCKSLPQWIQESLRSQVKFGPMFGLIRNFFATHKDKKQL